MLLLIPGSYTDKAIEKESVLVSQNLGPDSQLWINEKASQWYISTVIESGFYEGIHNYFIPSEEEKKSSKGMENLGGVWFEWIEGRIEALTSMIFQLYSRLALITMWSPYILILFIPAIFDGLMVRKVKQTNFESASTMRIFYSSRGLMLVIFLLFLSLFLPVAVNPSIIPVALMLCCVLVGIALGNMQKRV